MLKDINMRDLLQAGNSFDVHSFSFMMQGRKKSLHQLEYHEKGNIVNTDRIVLRNLKEYGTFIMK